MSGQATGQDHESDQGTSSAQGETSGQDAGQGNGVSGRAEGVQDAGDSAGSTGQDAQGEQGDPNRGDPGGLQAGREAGRLDGGTHQAGSGQVRRITVDRSDRDAPPVGQATTAEVQREEFADPTTQPARLEDLAAEYRKVLEEDLSIERLPPERRQIILNYFRNRRAATASQPGL